MPTQTNALPAAAVSSTRARASTVVRSGSPTRPRHLEDVAGPPSMRSCARSQSAITSSRRIAAGRSGQPLTLAPRSSPPCITSVSTDRCEPTNHRLILLETDESTGLRGRIV